MIALEHVFPRGFELAPAAGKPDPPCPGQAKSRDIMPDIGCKIHDIGTLTDVPISVIPDIGKRRYQVYPISVNTDIGIF